MDDTKTRETMQAKIEKLLAKAEGTDNPHEAEAFTARAEALMAEWGIEAALLDANRSAAERERVVDDESLTYTGSYAQAMTVFGAQIAEAMGVRAFATYHRGAKDRTLLLVGHQSDVDRARMLITSLHLQAQKALRVWWKGTDLRLHLAQSEKFHARRQFLMSFAAGAAERMRERRAEQESAKQTERDAAASTESGPSVALVLANRRDEVTAHVARKYPGARRGRGLRGSHYGHTEGRAAGRDADLGSQGHVNGRAARALA